MTTTEVTLRLPRRGKTHLSDLAEFAKELIALNTQVGFKIGARDWCYQLESFRLVDKEEFDKAERVIIECRKLGLLPVDFIAEEEHRKFEGVEIPTPESPEKYMAGWLEGALTAEEYFCPDWWDGEDYYIQMVVEKLGLKNMFEPLCHSYHIPIATSAGWSSILQRAEYARRFKEAERRGLQCVLLYMGDHDPDGLRISDFLRRNLEDIKDVVWSDGEHGYDPINLQINRFGLTFEQINHLNLTWIDNLHTGAQTPCPVCKLPKRLDDEHHPNFHMDYVQNYIKTVGVRKCEASAIIPRPDEARAICETAITQYLGNDALKRFDSKREGVRNRLRNFRTTTGLQETIEEALRQVKKLSDTDD